MLEYDWVVGHDQQWLSNEHHLINKHLKIIIKTPQWIILRMGNILLRFNKSDSKSLTLILIIKQLNTSTVVND